MRIRTFGLSVSVFILFSGLLTRAGELSATGLIVAAITDCTGLPDGTACDDGAPCTTGETCASGSCLAPASFSTSAVTSGSYQRGIVAGDFNGDGSLDLATSSAAGSPSGGIYILLNTGGGGFSKTAASPIGGIGPQYVAAGDFNRDGKLDLAVANYGRPGGDPVDILLGDGSGGFTPGTPIPTQSGCFFLTVGDLNRDGKPDLITDGDGTRIYMGNGSGQFTPGSAPPVAYPAVGDFNGDGKPDLAGLVAPGAGIALGDGSGHFVLAGTAAAGSNPWSVAIGDLNGDHKLDLIVANRDSNNVTILIGDGLGGLSAVGPAVPAGARPVAVDVEDWNGDGKLDLVVADYSGSVTILMGNASGGFTQGGSVSGGPQPDAIAVGDWNRDGKPDFAVATDGSTNNVIIHVNSRTGAPDGTSCDDGNACTTIDACAAGVCTGSSPVSCTPQDQCHSAGTCNSATGACSNPTIPNGTACSDGNACTMTDVCQSGACTPGNAVVCTASDQCHIVGVCNTGTGVCTNPQKASGATCSDGNACTVNEACSGGICGGGTCYCTERASGLVGWWPGDGNATDISGSGHSGTLMNGATFGVGEVGQAFSFDGVDDYVSNLGIASTFSFIETSGVFTIAAWIHLTDPSALTQQAITASTASTSEKGHFFLWENSDGLRRLRIVLTRGTTGQAVIDSTSPQNVITAIGWHHVAAVGDGTHITFYIDGVGSSGSGTMGALSTGGSTRAVDLARCPFTSPLCQFAGQLDEVQIFNRALSASEIQAVSDAGSQGVCKNCTDSDADGYGTTTGQTCHNGTLQDCNDADPTVHAPPTEVDNGARVARSGGVAVISWNLAAFASSSNVLRGLVDSLPVGPGGGDETCLGSSSGTSLQDSTTPAPGASFWYLIRGANSCGNGPYGFQELHGVPTVSRLSTSCP